MSSKQKIEIRKNTLEELINNIYQTHCILQENAAKAINYNLTIRNWLIGCYIIEFEQNGSDRAKYGTGLLEEIVKELKNKGLKGFSLSAMKNHRTFYLYYPQISQSVIGLLQSIDFQGTLMQKKPISLKSQSAIGSLRKETNMNNPVQTKCSAGYTSLSQAELRRSSTPTGLGFSSFLHPELRLPFGFAQGKPCTGLFTFKSFGLVTVANFATVDNNSVVSKFATTELERNKTISSVRNEMLVEKGLKFQWRAVRLNPYGIHFQKNNNKKRA